MNRWWGSASDAAKQASDRDQRASERNQRAARQTIATLPAVSDSDEDADYMPGESEETDVLEYDSDVSVSSSESVTSGDPTMTLLRTDLKRTDLRRTDLKKTDLKRTDLKRRLEFRARPNVPEIRL